MKLGLTIALALGLGTFAAMAQPHRPGGPGGFGGPPGGGPHHPPMPLMAVLDANTNRVLEASEIANAPVALAKLDKNADGKLTLEELLPPRPEGAKAGRPAAPPLGFRPPVPPLFAALDTNGDGELDAAEMANASASLLKLDANGDGQLTPDEIHPRPPGGPGGEEGPGEPPPADNR